MNRRQKNSQIPYPPLFDLCVSKCDTYCEQLNIKSIVFPLPVPEEFISDLVGLRYQMQFNCSFLKSKYNPTPSRKPNQLFVPDETSLAVEERIGALMKSLTEPKKGLIVLLVKGPQNLLLKRYHIIPSSIQCQPLCGIVIQLGSSREDKDHDDIEIENSRDEISERSIVGVFSSPLLPFDVAEELLTINLIRSIAESLNFEEIQRYKALEKGEVKKNEITLNSSPVGRLMGLPHERRFIAIETSDLLLCPTVFLQCLDKLHFRMHVENTRLPSGHDEVLNCRCIRAFNRGLASGVPKSDYFQFYMLKGGRIKEWIYDVIPDKPSKTIINCLKPN